MTGPQFHRAMRAKEPLLCWHYVDDGKAACMLVRGHDGGIHEPKPPKPPKKPRKTVAQLEQELEAERRRRQEAERANASLRRQVDPPDYSYFGLGDGPT